jgi:hypothetical protein
MTAATAALTARSEPGASAELAGDRTGTTEPLTGGVYRGSAMGPPGGSKSRWRASKADDCGVTLMGMAFEHEDREGLAANRLCLGYDEEDVALTSELGRRLDALLRGEARTLSRDEMRERLARRPG